MEEQIMGLVKNFDLLFMLICNLATFSVIKFYSEYLKHKKKNKVSTWTKRIISFVVGIIVGVCYYFINKDCNISILFNSFIAQFLTWDYVFKPIIKKNFKK